MIAMLPSGKINCVEKDFVKRGEVPRGDWLNYAIKVTIR